MFQIKLLLTVILLSSTSLYADELPNYSELDAPKQFWIRVFSEFDTKNGLIHDKTDLSIIYGNSTIKNKRKMVREIESRLRYLAKKGRARDEMDKKILSKFSTKPSAKRLIDAANNVRFQLGQANRFKAGLRRSGAWMDTIVSITSDYSLPKEIVALPFLESGFNPKARSHVGALGLWQFMRGTGARFLVVNRYLDQRRDPILSTEAAAKLLTYNYKILGSWPLAITAYNHGLGGMRRAVRTVGNNNIVDIINTYEGRRFGFASRNFYVELLAVSHLYFNRDQYFPDVELDTPLPRNKLKLKFYADIGDLSKQLKINRQLLIRLNPSLSKSLASGAKRIPRNTDIFVPAKPRLSTYLSRLDKLSDEKKYIAQIISNEHLVEPGDSLIRIASLYNVKLRDLMLVNNLEYRSIIRSGKTLDLPTNANLTKAKRRKKPGTKTKKKKQSKPIKTITTARANQQQFLSDPLDYQVTNNSITVKGGETLGHYAEWLGTDINKMRRANKLTRRSHIYLGQRIVLPFEKVSAQQFVQKRIDYQRTIQETFFGRFSITSTVSHTVRRGQTLSHISARYGDIPLWLIHQYNPNISDSLQSGMKLLMPRIQEK